jgi:ATP-dependent DNA ligase
MLAASTTRPDPPRGWVTEPKWDGFRAFVARWGDGRVLIRSRHGTDMTAGFPEIAEAAAALPDTVGDLLLDGELVIWHDGRLAFERLQSRLNRRPVAVVRLAAESPAGFVAFDLLHLGGQRVLDRPYRERRDRLEALFADFELGPPWTLCPATEDPADVGPWLSAWLPLGIEGVCFKDPGQRYQPGRRAWLKYRRRSTTEAVVGAVTGSLEEPEGLLLGRFDEDGGLRFVARSAPLSPEAAADLAGRLTPARRPEHVGEPEHPWLHERFTSRWKPTTPIEIALVRPELVAEFSADVPQDREGGWRQLVRFLRLRPELRPDQAPRFGERTDPTAADPEVAGTESADPEGVDDEPMDDERADDEP